MRLVTHKKTNARTTARTVKKVRIRRKISGSAERPRMTVFKSLAHIYVQLVDDVSGRTVLSASSVETEVTGSGKERARKIGQEIAKLALSKNITEVVFDRNGFFYHGRVKELADGAREAGLKF